MSEDNFNMQGLFGKLKDAQQVMMDKQKEAANKTVEVSVGGDMVKITMNGVQEIRSIKINKEIVNPNDIETLEDLIRAAVNEASRKSKHIFQDELKEMVGGMNIPGLNLFDK